MTLTKKRRALVAALVVALVLISGAAVRLVRVIGQTQAVCDEFMKSFSPPAPPARRAFTLFLNDHPTAGEWMGFKPGWTIEYKLPGPGGGVTYYVDLTGRIAHSEPLGFVETFERWRKADPVEQQLLRAERLEFIGADFPAEGGSPVFFFLLPRQQPLMLLSGQRRSAAESGPPDFQNIVIKGNRGETTIPAESASEEKLLTLLRTATINTNAGRGYDVRPSSERLQWLIERVENRW